MFFPWNLASVSLYIYRCIGNVCVCPGASIRTWDATLLISQSCWATICIARWTIKWDFRENWELVLLVLVDWNLHSRGCFEQYANMIIESTIIWMWSSVSKKHFYLCFFQSIVTLPLSLSRHLIQDNVVLYSWSRTIPAQLTVTFKFRCFSLLARRCAFSRSWMYHSKISRGHHRKAHSSDE
jgi:hypothetical protein